jgi:hypothetical protein
MDRQMQRLGAQVSLDVSFKLSKLISVDRAHPIAGVLTVMNEYDEIIHQALLHSKSHDEFRVILNG